MAMAGLIWLILASWRTIGLDKYMSNKFPHSVLFLMASLVCALMTALPVEAAEIFFGAHSTEVSQEKPFEVGVFLNTDGQLINAIEGKIIFPKDELDFLHMQDGGTIISLWIETPSVPQKNRQESSEVQEIVFSGIIPGGYEGSQGYLFSLIFQAKQQGQAVITTSDEKLLLHDGVGLEAQVRRAPLQLSIEDGIQGKEFTPPFDGEAPEPFTPYISRSEDIFEGRWFLVFSTHDKGTGIDHYEVQEKREYRVGRIQYAKGKWVRTESPYVLTDQQLKSTVSIKAVDRAGNERIEKIIAAYSLRWYENYLMWAIIGGVILIGGISLILWKSLRR